MAGKANAMSQIKQLLRLYQQGDSIKQIARSLGVEISERYELQFLEIGYESDHVHFLLQGVPSMSVSKLVTLLKSLTARALFKRSSRNKTVVMGWQFLGRCILCQYSRPIWQYGCDKEIYRKSGQRK